MARRVHNDHYHAVQIRQMEITQVPKSLTDISIMWRERSQAHINKAEDNDRLRADYFWLRLGEKSSI